LATEEYDALVDIDRYGLGKRRSMQQFYEFSGMRVPERRVDKFSRCNSLQWVPYERDATAESCGGGDCRFAQTGGKGGGGGGGSASGQSAEGGGGGEGEIPGVGAGEAGGGAAGGGAAGGGAAGGGAAAPVRTRLSALTAHLNVSLEGLFSLQRKEHTAQLQAT
jgi:hypothetical protein